MSSLMQHHGCTTKPKPGKVELLMYLHHEVPWYLTFTDFEWLDDRTNFKIVQRYRKQDSELVELQRPDGSKTKVAKLYRIWRKPAGMFGCWVVFRYNGEEHVPDLSIPIGVDKLPRDAEPLTDEEAASYWFTP